MNERKVAIHPNISSPGLSFILPANTGVMTGPSSPVSPGDSGIETASLRLLVIQRNARQTIKESPYIQAVYHNYTHRQLQYIQTICLHVLICFDVVLLRLNGLIKSLCIYIVRRQRCTLQLNNFPFAFRECMQMMQPVACLSLCLSVSLSVGKCTVHSLNPCTVQIGL